MDEKEITALAREYAEEISPVRLLDDYPEAKMIVDIMQKALSEATAEQIKDFEGFFRFLLRRFCLVEKEAVRKEYESVKDTPDECNYEELGATWDEWPYLSRFYDEGYKLGQKDAIESLFPEIAKEVEG